MSENEDDLKHLNKFHTKKIQVKQHKQNPPFCYTALHYVYKATHKEQVISVYENVSSNFQVHGYLYNTTIPF